MTTFKKNRQMCWKLQILKTPVNQEFQGTFRNGVKYLYGKSIERYDTISTLTRNDAYLVGNIKADKEKSAEKIDGAIATIIGLDFPYLRSVFKGIIQTLSESISPKVLFLYH